MRLITVLFLILCFFSFTGINAQNYNIKDLRKIREVHKSFQENHIDFDFLYPIVTKRFPYNFVRELDPSGKFLFEQQADSIYTMFKDFDFEQEDPMGKLDSVFHFYKIGLRRTQEILNKLEELDFFIGDSVFYSYEPDTVYFAESNDQLTRFWKRKIKSKILNRYASDSSLKELSDEKINQRLNELAKRIIEGETCLLEDLIQNSKVRIHVINSFLKAYAKSFDPHSKYIPEREEESFISELSSEGFSTGLDIGMNGNKVMVTDVRPFSSASGFEKIHKGDEITGVVVNGKMTAPVCIPDITLNELFYGKTVSSIEIEIRSAEDNQFRRFILEKTKTSNTYNHTFSFVLKKKDLELGYIKFPGFYSAFGAEGRSSAQDVALILRKLKATNARGLILDLRANGGGSVYEADDLIGFFVDLGPAYLITNSENPEGVLMKDTKRGKVWDRKVIVLVNNLSASASELLAASLQFYPNVLVVGSNTYGKATGQQIIPLEAGGFSVVTEMKIYRMDGSNYQGFGMEPDIILPSIYPEKLVSEVSNKNIIWHSKIRKSFYPRSIREEPIDSLRILSKDRVKSNPQLLRMDSIKNVLEDWIFTDEYRSLQYTNFTNLRSSISDIKLDETHPYFEMESLEENEVFIQEGLQHVASDISDPILIETFKILEDWIRLTN